ncbi:hypothetical protein [Brasilonema sp. UFV-L1]|uniref:hypothetical protein n=1 Tax=Brasilonema sp. UFV-L1 TaxID=2234130 RepID=UPI00145E6F5F|nr:hypothetical protein [Brasilonema sp. UFV-L1]
MSNLTAISTCIGTPEKKQTLNKAVNASKSCNIGFGGFGIFRRSEKQSYGKR